MPPQNIDLKNIKKYPEFQMLKEKLEELCDKMDSIEDIDLENISRITIAEEIYGRQWAKKQVTEFLANLGLVESPRFVVKDNTHE